MECDDLRYLRTSLFSQNEQARLFERVNQFVYNIQTEIYLKFKGIY